MLFSVPFDENSPKKYRIASQALCDDLKVIEIGYNRTPNGLRQVMKREVYILHYVAKGCGNLCGEHFEAGDGYVVFPNELETIVSDQSSPYESYWIMFQGPSAPTLLKKCNIPQHNGVFKFDKTEACTDILHQSLFESDPVNDFEEAALMYAAFFKILSLHSCDYYAERSVDTIPRKIIEFINNNYYNGITVDAIAKMFNFSRNYLYSLFKKEYGLSPQEYLLKLRMEKAKELLLKERHLLISEVALAVGYNDALYFSRVFRKKVGVSPTEYMKMHM